MSGAVLKKNDDSNRPDIFSYQDYKVFLRDYIHYLKTVDAGFSARRIAEESNTSNGYISTILNSERNITEKAVEKLLPFLKLSRPEASYLRILCTITKSSTHEERMEALGKLKRFQKFSKLNPSEALTTQYMSKWYYVAIRELANHKDFKMDAEWIQNKLNFAVAIGDVSKALDFLLRNGLIVVKPNGKFAASEAIVYCEGDIYRYILTHFHHQIFDLAKKAIDNTPRENRNIRGYTINLSKEFYDKAKVIMDRALEEIAGFPQMDTEAAVYHFLFTGFPLSKVKKEDE